MDGRSQFRFFSAVVMPLSKAIIAVLALFYGVSHWNEYMRALIYLKKESLYPLQLILSSILIENQVSAAMVDDVLLMEEKNMLKELIKHGVIVVASVPVLVAYPFLQKFFIKGVMLGSIKG
jgi:ABC-type glycerol-3-phosphate transport system permease component